MSLPRFFLDSQVLVSEVEETFPLRLSKDDAKHAKVLRLKAGEHIAVVDADTDYFECEIVEFDDVYPVVRITQHQDAANSRPQVILVQGLAKGDKMDDVIRHATELGVSGFIPLACERSIVKLDAKKAESRNSRWKSIAKSAAMQSGQPAVPEIMPVSSLTKMCHDVAEATAVLICWEESDGSVSIREAIERGMRECSCCASDAKIAIVVGPEGGLSQTEVEYVVKNVKRASVISLGASILRTETAGIVAPALVLYELGSLGPR